VVEVGELAFGPIRSSAKGSVESSLRRQRFQTPFGAAFQRSIQDEAPQPLELSGSTDASRSPWLKIAEGSAVGAGAVALGVGAVFGVLRSSSLSLARDLARSGLGTTEVRQAFTATIADAETYMGRANLAYGSRQSLLAHCRQHFAHFKYVLGV
jgi:hypothetical protein